MGQNTRWEHRLVWYNLYNRFNNRKVMDLGLTHIKMAHNRVINTVEDSNPIHMMKVGRPKKRWYRSLKEVMVFRMKKSPIWREEQDVQIIL